MRISKNPCVLPHTKARGLSGIFGDRKLEVALSSYRNVEEPEILISGQLPQHKCERFHLGTSKYRITNENSKCGLRQFSILRKKQAQQEILGFVVIVVLVVIVGVIFLGISLRKSRIDSGISTDDAEIANFLSASSKYTTECVLREPFYADMKDVISGCFDSKSCKEMNNSCEVLKDSYAKIIDRTWSSGADRPIKHTKLSIYYQADTEDSSSRANLIEPIESGNAELCSVKRAGRYVQFESPGRIIAEFEICSGQE